MTYYMVFERPVGSKCWSVVLENKSPKYGTDKARTLEWCREVYPTRRGFIGGVPGVTPLEWCVVPVTLPA